MRDVGTLVGEGHRGEQLATSFLREMAHVAADVPSERRRTALFLDIYDTQLWGGTCGSSYDDVLTAAGLIDVAPCDPQSPQSWPRFSTEQVVAMHPSVIVTSLGKASQLRAMPALANTLLNEAQIIELEDVLLRDPGPAMLHAAEQLRAIVYPEKEGAK
jgi:iron complex transport system substrate-binding protein